MIDEREISQLTTADFLHAINREQRRLAVRSWQLIAGYIVFASLPYIYLDFYYWDLPSAYAWAGFFAWALTYILLLSVMQRGGYFQNGKASGVGTYFALGLVVGFAVSLALIVLIVPGLYLIMRWLPVFARALTHGESITASMRWSWDVTERFQTPLSLALIGPVACYGIAVAASFSYSYEFTTAYRTMMVIMNVSTSLGYAWLTILGAASFRVLSKQIGEMAVRTHPASTA